MEFEKDDIADAEKLLQQVAKKNIIEKERLAICDRGAVRRVKRQNNENRLEDEFYQDYVQTSSDSTAGARLKLNQEEKLCKELVFLNQSELRKIKYKQHFRETSLELQNVERKLRAAYTQKEVAAQIAENEYTKQKERDEKLKADEILRQAAYTANEKAWLEKQEEIIRKAEYKKELQKQMIVKYQMEQYDYEEKMRHKKELDAIVKRINDEEVKIIKDKKEQMRKTQEEILQFKNAQAIWKERKRRELDEENRQIEEMLKEKELDAREKDRLKKEPESAKDKRMQEIAKKMFVAQVNKDEREELLYDYFEFETALKREEENRKKTEKEIYARFEEQNVLELQLQEKKERDEKEMMEEKRWGKVILDFDQAFRDKERIAAEKKRASLIELRKEHEETIKLRRAERAEELKIIESHQEQNRLRQEEKQRMLDAERLALLQAHASNLIGYIPPGTIQPGDLEKLGPEFVRTYASK